MLSLPAEQREALWRRVFAIVETYLQNVDSLPVAPNLDLKAIRAYIDAIDWQRPVTPEEALAFADEGLTRFQVHTPHARYWGLFNPASTSMGIAADTLVAAFNPQIAAWSHNPFAAEVERVIVQRFGELFGYREDVIDGVLASGGMEANHTALLTALTDKHPEFLTYGLRSLPCQPVFYVSAECHHSFPKAARMCGLGSSAVRHVPVDSDLRMRVDALEQMIEADKASDQAPFAVMATAGTTNAGAIDPLPEIAQVARRYELWFHVDAAWGGGAAFVPELRHLLDGIELSDSITFDAHKWLSVPMGAGVYLTSDPEILDRTFSVPTQYMPKDAEGLNVVDPHLHSMQWSRRFIGLKIFLSLAVAGMSGYEEAIRHQTRIGALLRSKLAEAGWTLTNNTPLPVVCFTFPGATAQDLQAIIRHVLSSGEAWISTTVCAGERTVLRACVTNFRSSEKDVDALVASLERARSAVKSLSGLTA